MQTVTIISGPEQKVSSEESCVDTMPVCFLYFKHKLFYETSDPTVPGLVSLGHCHLFPGTFWAHRELPERGCMLS